MIELPNVTALYAALAFGICYLILKKYLFLPLGRILDARESEEREAQKAYAESLRALEQAVAAGEQKLSEARREALKVREGLRAKGMALLEEKLAKAREEASHQIDRGAGRSPRRPRISLVSSRARRRPRPRARRKDSRTKARSVIGPALLPGVLPAVLLLSSEEGEHAAEKFLASR
jgi:hypothetical protein